MPDPDVSFIFDEIVERALREDVRSGDITSEAVLSSSARGIAHLVARQDLVCSALDVAELVFRKLDPGVSFLSFVGEGEGVTAGATLATVEGALRPMLAAERTALNLLQRACGIATATRRCVDAVAEFGVEILDTRKTAPGQSKNGMIENKKQRGQ